MTSKGPVLVLASQVVAVIIHGLAKFLETTGSVEPQQILQVRMFITLSINCLLLASRSPNELPLGTKNIRGLLALRTVGGICGSTGFYYSLEYLPLADATILNLLAPLGASLATSKRFNLLQFASVAICFLGVGLISKPHFVVDLLYNTVGDRSAVSSDQNRWTSQTQLGFAFAMIGTLGGVVGTSLHFGIVIISTICFAVVPGVSFNFKLGLFQWLILCLIGLCGALMEYLLTAGLSAEDHSHAVHMIYLQVVFALLADGLVWHTVPDIASCLGAALVVLALFVTQNTKDKV
ncbi:hypothetical protein OIDMADRAFT_48961 [Oidiodendron maius Zn]|uniref:EamA domain-containing protein n=1 Tax=Oidiodendron maius (strain Zn) TaxID=913774 RepID=A0A0C3I480_OIDMZ|nr:hypothetical protein OIDMADRAFT_48961 [Oidiodendron maius Zn]